MVFACQCYQSLVRVGAERDSHGVDHMQLSTRLWRPRQKGFVLSREDDFSGGIARRLSCIEFSGRNFRPRASAFWVAGIRKRVATMMVALWDANSRCAVGTFC